MNSDNNNDPDVIADQERKRKRLEAWKRRQQQQQAAQEEEKKQKEANKPKLSLSISFSRTKKKKKPAASVAAVKKKNAFATGFNDNDDFDDRMEGTGVDRNNRKKRPLDLLMKEEDMTIANNAQTSSRKRRWDNVGDAKPATASASDKNDTGPFTNDALDEFMDKLQAGAMGVVNGGNEKELSIDIGGSIARTPYAVANPPAISGGVITAEELENLQNKSKTDDNSNDNPLYHPNEWLSDAATDNEEENEEEARRALIEALKEQPPPVQPSVAEEVINVKEATRPAQLAAEVKSEKSRREERFRELERQAAEVRAISQKAEPELGRYLYDDLESGVMEEAERDLEAAKAKPDALLVLAELNKKKEIQAVDHSKIDYLPFTKNLYRVPRALADLKHEDVVDRRAKLKVRVRGQGAPAPVQTFEQAGLSETILNVLRQQGIYEPYPIQAQCIPCIMAGRDTIGIAKTGSGKSLAYLLPLLRHILVQPPLAPNESGPIGLILAPARELAFQIHTVCKAFAKQLNIKSTAVYGGAGVAEQIADLKRGTHIVTATPGRLIDILTMQSGKILSLRRVTYVVMDEADRMFDMGFAPQISAVLAAIRPDRQTVLFSATFPKAIESLARKSLKYPVEVMVGGRSVASDNVTQYAELVEEEDKFLRLLQILGEQVEGTKKVIVFVDTQVRADSLFEQLLRNGYSTLTLHGGKDQEDRDSTISDFKLKDGPNVLVATGVAGRGLDVPACTCVINYSAPNHLEAYVHQTGRTGRAGKKGVCYTFVNSTEEFKFAPIVVRALIEAGQSENIGASLKKLSEDFKVKVEKGEARYAGSGFKGKGYTYDSNEMNEAQRMARLEKRQALIEAGLLDPDDEDPLLSDQNTDKNKSESSSKTEIDKDADGQMKIPENLTPELLALPGMKEALLRKAGIIPAEDLSKKDERANDSSLGQPIQTSDSHWVQEFEINDYPREARWKVTQKETTSRLQEEFRTATTLKGSYFPPGKEPAEGERKLYLHLEATSGTILRNGVMEIQRLLNEETLRVGAKATSGNSHKYNVLG